jgi:hypothetical protein
MDNEKRRGLGHLRTSFLLFAIGAPISLVPVVGSAGGLLTFVGVILLIMGWRALGRSSLPSAAGYRSTGRWIIYSIIIAIVVGGVAVFMAIVIFVSSLVGSGFPTGALSPSGILQTQAFQDYLANVFLGISAAEIPVFYALYRISSSLRTLGTEVGQPRLGTAGRLLLVYFAVAFVTLVGTSLAFTTGAISISPTVMQGVGAMGNQYAEFAGAYAPFFFLGTAASALLLLLASYLAYGGIKRAQA